jgi:CO/xanthine dehydrogenase Mo-binding subunit
MEVRADAPDRRAGPPWIGQPLARHEDGRLLRGEGCFVADVTLPGTLHLAVLRSPHAAARILSVNRDLLARRPGIVDVVTAADLEGLPGPIPLYRPHPRLRARTPCPLARGRVRYVGEPVAAVLADDPGRAADALDARAVDYAIAPAVVDPVAALDPGAPLVHPELESNLAAEIAESIGDPEAAFRAADTVVRVALRLGRQSPQPLEPRAVLAQYSRAEAMLTVWDTTQSPPMVRRILAYLLRLPESQVRVIAPDLGGGFGGKNRFYPEEFLAAFLALRHRRPVRWVAGRHEDLLAMYQEREQVQEGELALRADGTVLGLRISYVDAAGAYTPFGIVTSHMTAMKAVGPYRIANFAYRYRVAYTNKPGLAPYRGAGQPQGAFLIERLMDRAAGALGVDPAALRLRNMVTSAEQPYDSGLRRDGRPLVYDGGDYPRAFGRALELIGYARLRANGAGALACGRRRGVGAVLALEVASTGTAESARVEIEPTGAVTVASGAVNLGQGLATALAQVCADHLGVDPGRVRVALGDTALAPAGGGSFASRSAVAAGNAVALAAHRVREKLLAAAAHFLEAAPGDLEIAGETVAVRGLAERAIPIAAVAEAVAYPNFGARWRWPQDRAFPWGDEPGLQAAAAFRPDFTFGYGAHAAVVEVDPETGAVAVTDYAVVHDSGRVLNPAIVAGQVAGAVAQGLGGALWEEVVHDAQGQPLTASLMDYALPRAAEVPALRLDHLETPAPNPLGVKGAGEGGIIPVAAAIAAAVDDALAPWGVFCDRTPLTAVRLWAALQRGPAGTPCPGGKRAHP